MSQTYTIDCFVAAHGGQADLAVMENNFESLRSMFSGAGAPANSVAGMHWFDTTQKLLKVKNDANDAWLGILAGTVDLKMLVYRNTAEDGWAIDGGVTDRVVAIKGGATYTTGGATAGSWTLPDYTLLEADVPPYDPGAEPDHQHGAIVAGGTYSGHRQANGTFATTNLISANSFHGPAGGHTHASFGGGGSHNHGATYRPAAAVVTIQYPDI